MQKAPIFWNFGKVEAVLADLNEIAPSKRTAFQSRLKNFHRLGFPIGFKLEKGKAAKYSPVDAVLMAFATELTQLGLTPEMVVKAMAVNHLSILSMIEVIAHHSFYVPKRSDAKVLPESERTRYFFVSFDPRALSNLTTDVQDVKSTLEGARALGFDFWAKHDWSDLLDTWQKSSSSRLSIVNLTSLIDRVFASGFSGEAASDRGRTDYFENLKTSAMAEQQRISDVDHDLLLRWIGTCVRQDAPQAEVELVVDMIFQQFKILRKQNAIIEQMINPVAKKRAGNGDPEA